MKNSIQSSTHLIAASTGLQHVYDYLDTTVNVPHSNHQDQEVAVEECNNEEFSIFAQDIDHIESEFTDHIKIIYLPHCQMTNADEDVTEEEVIEDSIVEDVTEDSIVEENVRTRVIPKGNCCM